MPAFYSNIKAVDFICYFLYLFVGTLYGDVETFQWPICQIEHGWNRTSHVHDAMLWVMYTSNKLDTKASDNGPALPSKTDPAFHYIETSTVFHFHSSAHTEYCNKSYET